jgi:hypothetical protein
MGEKKTRRAVRPKMTGGTFMEGDTERKGNCFLKKEHPSMALNYRE